MIELLSGKTIDLTYDRNTNCGYVQLRPLAEKQIHLKHASLARAMKKSLPESVFLFLTERSKSKPSIHGHLVAGLIRGTWKAYRSNHGAVPHLSL